MEILEGQAAADFYDLRMEIGKAVHHVRSEGSLGLTTPSDETAQLLLDDARFVSNVDETAPFGALLDLGLAEPFLEWAPGDQVPTRIHGVKVSSGQALAVRGVPAHRTETGEGYRDVVAKLDSVNVEALAVGPEAAAALKALPDAPEAPVKASKPKPPADEKKPVSVALPLLLLLVGSGALAAGVGLAGVDGSLRGRALTALPAGLALLAAGLLLLRRKRFLPDLRKTSEDLQGVGKRTGLGNTATAAVGMGLLLELIGGSMLWGPGGRSAILVLGMIAIVVVMAGGAGLALFRGERRSLGRLKQLYGAAPKLESKKWGAMSGRVTGGTYSRVRSHSKNRSTYVDAEGRTKRTTFWDFEDAVGAEKLSVKLENGETLEVVLGKEALIASTRVLVKKDQLIESIEVGDVVRVVGRPTKVDDGWSVASKGKASLLVLGMPSDQPAGMARRGMAAHLLTLGVLGAIAAAAIALLIL